MGDVRIERAIPGMFEELLPLLTPFEKGNPQLNRDRWRRLFHYTWPIDDDLRGFVLRDGGRPVGVICLLLSDRLIAGRRERICNVTTWHVLPEYRAHSLELIVAVSSLENMTITMLTPLPKLDRFHRSLGFRTLESKFRILLPWPDPRQLVRSLRVRATRDPRRIEQLLRGEQAQIFREHLPHFCQHLAIHEGERCCHLVFTKTKGRRFHFSHIQHISDRDFFLEALDRVKFELFLANGTLLTMIDERLLRGRETPHSKIAQMLGHRLFISPRVAAEDIDNLYSELVVLGV